MRAVFRDDARGDPRDHEETDARPRSHPRPASRTHARGNRPVLHSLRRRKLQIRRAHRTLQSAGHRAVHNVREHEGAREIPNR